jgi:probable HAF family extracellular repeat protein
MWFRSARQARRVVHARSRRTAYRPRLEALEDRVVLATIVDLGTLPGKTESDAFGINAAGQVVGFSQTAFSQTGDSNAFLYTSQSGMQAIPEVPGGSLSGGRGINDAGQAVGSSWIDSALTDHAFLYSSAGGSQDLDPLLGGNGSDAWGINNAGQVVGDYYLPQFGVNHAFLYSSVGGMKDLGTLPGLSASTAFRINSAGEVVGWSTAGPNDQNAPYNYRAFLYTSQGGMQDLGALPGMPESWAYGINSAGEVVGTSKTLGGPTHAFLYTTQGGMKDLGTLPGATYGGASGINDAGYVVGSSDSHGFLYTSQGKMIDLNGLLPNGSGWLLEDPWDINDSGQITGTGSLNGQKHAFILNLDRVVVDSVKTSDSKTLTIDYDVTTPNFNQPFDIGIYRNKTSVFEQQNQIADITIQRAGNESEGHHKVTVLLQGGLPPEPEFPYVHAVADPQGKLVGVITESSKAYFRVYVIGAVVPGFDISSGFSSSAPGWVQTMATSLGPQGVGYDEVIPFFWQSGLINREPATDAGDRLAQQIIAAASSIPNLQPDDTIDVHLIGHSRGATVISQAMQFLLASPPTTNSLTAT